MLKIYCWNVNGIRAVVRKGLFAPFVEKEKPDIICLQETKATVDDVEQLWPATYTTHWNSAQKKGYAGTAIYTRHAPSEVVVGWGDKEFDAEVSKRMKETRRAPARKAGARKTFRKTR